MKVIQKKQELFHDLANLILTIIPKRFFMTNFLPAGMINETISDINQKAREMKTFLAENRLDQLQKALEELEEIALDLWVFIERFQCEPLIYTGPGKTDEVIKRLEWALAFSEEDLEQMLKNINSKKKA